MDRQPSIHPLRIWIGEVIFWLHFVMVLFWWGLFLVPTSLWPSRIAFHFYITLVIVGHQFVWGAVISPWTKKYQMVCTLTTLMQWIRGERLSDERNFRHQFTKEFFERIGFGSPLQGATILTAIITTIVTIQFFFFR